VYDLGGPKLPDHMAGDFVHPDVLRLFRAARLLGLGAWRDHDTLQAIIAELRLLTGKEPWDVDQIRVDEAADELLRAIPADARASHDEAGTKAPAGPAEPLARVSWHEAAERLERLRAQGEPWTSQHDMAERFGCSPATINKAIDKTPGLQAWAKRQTAPAPKAQSLNGSVTDRTADAREPNPEDAAAEVELLKMIEDACPDERAFLHYLRGAPPDYQLWYIEQPPKVRKRHLQAWKRRIESDATAMVWFLEQPLQEKLALLNDPDEHQRILGRQA
jgi:hypothetical protein